MIGPAANKENDIKILRTPDGRFENLPGWPFEPHYTDITDPFKIEVIGETDTGEVILKSVDWTVGLVMGHQSDSLSIELTGVPTPLSNIRVAVDGGNSESLSEISECYETNNEDNWGSIICL